MTDSARPPVDDEAEELARHPSVAPAIGPTGPADSAGGGYGSASGDGSSGGTAEGAGDETPAGTDPATDWLRRAPGGDGGGDDADGGGPTSENAR